MKQLIIVLAVLCGAAGLQGCETLRGPQKAAATAQTVQQRLELRGYAIEASYNIILEDALVIASAPTTNASVRGAIQRASATGTDVIDQLSDALAAYSVERAKFDTNQSTVEKLTLAADNLENWITRGDAALIALQAAFR
jgi:hypothetical protein